MEIKVAGELKEYNRTSFSELLESDFPDDGSVLMKYPHNEDVFRPKFGVKLFNVPEGYVAVNKFSGSVSRTIPLKGKGFRMMFGLFGWGQSAHVVNIDPRTVELGNQNVITRDGVQLPGINATLNYVVFNPAEAIAALDYRKTSLEVANGLVVDYVGNNTLEELLRAKEGDSWNERNLTTRLNDNNEWESIELPDVTKVGVKLTNLFITDIKYPQNLMDELARKATAEAEASGIKQIADARAHEKKALADAEAYEIKVRLDAISEATKDMTESQKYVRMLEAIENIGEGQNNTFYQLPSFLSDLVAGKNNGPVINQNPLEDN